MAEHTPTSSRPAAPADPARLTVALPLPELHWHEGRPGLEDVGRWAAALVHAWPVGQRPSGPICEVARSGWDPPYLSFDAGDRCPRCVRMTATEVHAVAGGHLWVPPTPDDRALCGQRAGRLWLAHSCPFCQCPPVWPKWCCLQCPVSFAVICRWRHLDPGPVLAELTAAAQDEVAA